MESWIDLLEWPAMLVTVVAAWCIGSHRPGRRMVGFCCFIASNILWSVWGWHAQAWALIVLQLVLCLMNLRGGARINALQGKRLQRRFRAALMLRLITC